MDIFISVFVGTFIGVFMGILLIAAPKLETMEKMAIERGAAEMVCEGTSCKFTWKVVE